MVFSELRSFAAEMTRRDVVGLKYVMRGEENYVLNGKRNRVKAGQLLIVDDFTRGEAFNPASTGIASGLCINLDKKLVSEVISAATASTGLDQSVTDVPVYDFSFPVAPASQLRIGRLLAQLGASLMNGNDETAAFDPSLFHRFAEELVGGHAEIEKKMQSLPAGKRITQQELFRRLLLAREIIDDCLYQKMEVASLAAHAGLSEYYFSRSFRSAFGISPYQYQLNKRIDEAFKLLSTGKLSVSEIAHLTGFADIHSFSKMYKKHRGVSTSKVNRE